MFRSYLTLALRTLRRRLGYTAVNVIGLTVGLACCALVTVFLQYELSWDHHHADADRIYRILTDYWSSTYSTIPFQGYNGPAFADLFTFKRLAGPPLEEALAQPYSAVLPLRWAMGHGQIGHRLACQGHKGYIVRAH